MRIAIFSPIPPQKTGVASVVDPIVRQLGMLEDIDVELFVDGGKVSISNLNYQFPVHDFSEYNNETVRNMFHMTVFHMGNNIEFHEEIYNYFFKYGGILELHDICFYDFMFGYTVLRNNIAEFLKCMEYCHGISRNKLLYMLESGEANPYRVDPLKRPLVRHMLDKADAIIVHSSFASYYVRGINPAKQVFTVPLPIPESSPKQVHSHSEFIETDCLTLGSFGYITSDKRIESILDALIMLKNDNVKFKYFLVGKDMMDVESLIRERDLSGEVFCVGWVNEEKFDYYIGLCDLCLNLRYPTRGESSAGLHWILAQGKNAVVSKIGSFQEYPDDVVFKISTGRNETVELYSLLKKLSADRFYLKTREPRILQYARMKYSASRIAEQYKNFFFDFYHYHTFYQSPLDRVTDILCEMGFQSREYVQHICEDDVIQNMLENQV